MDKNNPQPNPNDAKQHSSSGKTDKPRQETGKEKKSQEPTIVLVGTWGSLEMNQKAFELFMQFHHAK